MCANPERDYGYPTFCITCFEAAIRADERTRVRLEIMAAKSQICEGCYQTIGDRTSLFYEPVAVRGENEKGAGESESSLTCSYCGHREAHHDLIESMTAARVCKFWRECDCTNFRAVRGADNTND